MFSLDVFVLEMIQSFGEGIYILMKSLSKIGESNNYFLVIVFLMWCLNYQKYSSMAFLVPLSGLMTAGLKYAIQMPRPYHISDEIDIIKGYGMPSGHSMSAVVFWGYLSYVLKKKWFFILSIFLIIGISISRIYRNSHYPSQVMIGLLIGILILWLFNRYQHNLSLFLHKLSLQKALLISSVLPLFFIVLTVIIALIDFSENGMEDVESVFSNGGLLFGFSVGLYLMSKKGILNSKVSILKQLLKILIILISFSIVVYANKYVSKVCDFNLWIGLLCVAITNYFIALWFCFYGPLLFSKVKLFKLEKNLTKSKFCMFGKESYDN